MFTLGSLLMLWTLLAAAVPVGRRLCDLLPFRLRPASRLYFSPLLGTAVLVLAATAHGWAASFNPWTVLAEFLLLALPSVYFDKDKKGLVRTLSLLAPYALIASTTVLLPVLRYGCYNSFNDAFTYLVHGQWLQSNAFHQAAPASGHFPAATQVVLYQQEGQRMGASFLLGWAQALFRLPWSYHAYPAVLSLALTAGSLAVGGTISLAVRRPPRLMVLLSSLAAAVLLNGYAFGAMNGFYPQTFGLGFVLGGAALLAASLEERLRPGDGGSVTRRMLPVSLLFAAVVFCYNDILPFVGVGVAGILALLLLFFRRDRAGRFLPALAVLVVQTLLLVNLESVRTARNFVRTLLGVGGGSHPIGWPVLWNPVEFLGLAFGVRCAVRDAWLLWYGWLTAPLLLAVLAAALWTLWSRRRALAPAFAAPLCLAGVFAAGFLYFRYAAAGRTPGEVGQTFLQFKMAQWAGLPCAALLGAAFSVHAREFKKWRRPAFALFSSAVVLALVFNVPFMRALTKNFLIEAGVRRNAFSVFAKVREAAEDVPPGEVIHLNFGGEHHKLRQMAAYVLHDRLLAGDYRDDGYLADRLPEGQKVISAGEARWTLDHVPPSEADRKSGARTGSLVLRRRP